MDCDSVSNGVYQGAPESESMAPGGNVYQDVAESPSSGVYQESRDALADYGVKSPNVEGRSGHRICGSAGARLRLASNSDVHEQLEFPVCLNIMCPPIHQCPNGHTLCVVCKTKVQNICPICRHELGNIRCLALEKVAESIELPCKYHCYGCQDILPYHSRVKHKESVECLVTGDIPFIVAHLKADHNVDMHDGSSFNH